MLVLKAPRQTFDEVVFTPDGRGLAARSDRTAHYWPTFDAPPRVFRSEFLGGFGLVADGRHVVTYTQSDGMRVYGPDDDRGVRFPSRASARSFACSPTESLVVVRTTHRWRWSGWRLGPRGKWERLWAAASRSSGRPWFSPDGGRVFQVLPGRLRPDAMTYEPATVEEYDPRTGERADSRGTVGFAPYDGGAVAPGAEWMACTYNAELWVLKREARWRAVVTRYNDGRKHFTGVAFHPSGQFLATASNDRAVKLYDTASWEVAKTFTWDIGRMRSIAFSPDGALAAAGSDSGKVVVWDVDV
jgi:WD40 repeat protein